MSDTSKAGRTTVLDAARGLAVLWVIAYHAWELTIGHHRAPGSIGAGWWLVGAGSLAVDLFFVLSGFLLVGSWQASRQRSRTLRAAVADYGRKRALRILPAYWVSLLVFIPLAAPGMLRSLGDLSMLASVQQYFSRDLPGQVNVVYWTLTTEVHFYILLPVLALLLRRCSARVLVPACICLGVAWRLWTPGDLPDGMLLGRVDQFAVGMAAAGMVAAADRGTPGRIVRLLLTRYAGWVLGLSFFALALYQGSSWSTSEPLPGWPFIHPVAGLLVGGLLIRWMVQLPATAGVVAPAAVNGLAAAGVISYSLYLFHFPILEHGLRSFGLLDPTSAPAAVLVGMAVLLTAIGVVATLSYRYVERPFLERKRKRPEPAKAGKPTAPSAKPVAAVPDPAPPPVLPVRVA